MKTKYLKIFLGLSLALNAALLVAYFGKDVFPSYMLEKEDVEDVLRYPHLSPRVFQEFSNDIFISFLPLREKLNLTAGQWGDDFALYFEYLPSGMSIGVNSAADFSTASLIKVPVAIAFLQKVDAGKVDLSQKVVIEPRHADMAFGTLWQSVGEEISLGEALRLMLAQSDNTAYTILSEYVTFEELEDVQGKLDLSVNIEEEQVVMNARQFTSVMKALYFSSLLSYESSELILKHLASSGFDDKLVAGVPSDIEVASKIGVLPDRLYSECGIVYLPRRPYILCMISGTDETTARERMETISGIVYDYVSGVNH